MDANYFNSSRLLIPEKPLLPSRRTIAIGLGRDAPRILVAMAMTLLVTFGIYLAVPARYASNASLLVLLSSDYGYRPEAGSPVQAAAMLQKDAFLKSEIEILTSSTLEREVIKKIGVGALYPRYLESPSLIAMLITEINSGIRSVKSDLGLKVTPPVPVTPEDMALTDFSRALNAVADKDGNFITVSFRHKDPRLAADVVNTLIASYLDRRAGLYRDVQSQAMAGQVSQLREQLYKAAQAYADFKSRTGISDYGTQRVILLRQQGDISRDLELADSTLQQDRNRLQAVESELATTPPDVTLYSESSRLHLSNGTSPHGESTDETSAARAEANRRALDAAPTMVRKGRNEIFDKLRLARSGILQDVEASRARIQADKRQMATTASNIRNLEASEVELLNLDRDRSLIDQSYRTATLALDNQLFREGVDAKKQTNIRVIQPGEVPLKQTPLRMLILAGGLIITAMVGIMVTVLSTVLRRGYIVDETLEYSLGVPVLVDIPELPSIASELSV